MRHFPDIPKELAQSAKNVANAMRETRSKGLAGQFMDSVTNGFWSATKQALVVLPGKIVGLPVARTVNDAVRGTVAGALNLTGRAIASIPWIPAPGRSEQPSQPQNNQLASSHEQSPPSLPRPGDPGGGTRQSA